ncbi:MAG: LAGLIDADG family homing endonuclease [Nitrososphaeraceae archaeon]
MEDLHVCPADDGIFIIQMNYLKSMIEQNTFDNICFKPDTLILGCNKAIKDIKNGDSVIGYDGEPNTVMKTMSRMYKGDMIRIDTKYLEDIVCTPEHPLLVVKKEKTRFDCGQFKPKHKRSSLDPEWIDAKDLKRGDYLVVPRLKPKTNMSRSIDLREFNWLHSPNHRRGLYQIPLDEDTAWMMGLYVAEGHPGGRENNRYIDFTLNKNEIWYINKLDTIVKTLGYTLQKIPNNINGGINLRIVCSALTRAFEKWFKKGALNKQIPDFLLHASDNIRQAFLRGLFDGDGYNKGNKIHLHTSSRILVYQVQLMLASLGEMVGISWSGGRISIIRGMEVLAKESCQLRGSSRGLSLIFDYEYDDRGFAPIHIIKDDEFVYIPIKEISNEFYEGEVCNIETENNTYLVNNAVVHNCNERLCYYNIRDVVALVKRTGLTVIDAQLNDVNGGSVRLYIQSSLPSRPDGRSDTATR